MWHASLHIHWRFVICHLSFSANHICMHASQFAELLDLQQWPSNSAGSKNGQTAHES